MKICLLGNARSIHCVRWANAFRQLGHDVWLISLNPPAIHPLDPGVQIDILPFRPPFGYYLSFPKAKSIINKINPDILNTHYASGYGTLSRLINFQPTLLSVWGLDVFDVPYQNKYMFRLVRKNLMAATRIASTSRIMRDQVKKIITLKEEIFITPFGVDLNIFRQVGNQNPEKITIGIIKTIAEKYGQTYLVKAFKIILERLETDGLTEIANKLNLQIIGDGPQREDIHKMIYELDLTNRVRLPGEISHSAVPEHLNRFDIACFPSTVNSESFGVAAVEASACEIPVIAANIGGLPEVVVDGKTGLLFEPKNEIDLADKLYRLVMDPELRNRMGKTGRRFVAENYSWDENVSRMEQYYYQIIRNKTKFTIR